MLDHGGTTVDVAAFTAAHASHVFLVLPDIGCSSQSTDQTVAQLVAEGHSVYQCAWRAVAPKSTKQEAPIPVTPALLASDVLQIIAAIRLNEGRMCRPIIVTTGAAVLVTRAFESKYSAFAKASITITPRWSCAKRFTWWQRLGSFIVGEAAPERRLPRLVAPRIGANRPYWLTSASAQAFLSAMSRDGTTRLTHALPEFSSLAGTLDTEKTRGFILRLPAEVPAPGSALPSRVREALHPTDSGMTAQSPRDTDTIAEPVPRASFVDAASF